VELIEASCWIGQAGSFSLFPQEGEHMLCYKSAHCLNL
jgi:hypothetical protein